MIVYLIKGIVSGNCRYVSASEDSKGYSLLRLAETISEMVVRRYVGWYHHPLKETNLARPAPVASTSVFLLGLIWEMGWETVF